MEHGFKKVLNHHPGGFGYETRIQEGSQSPSWSICLWNTDSRRMSITILVDLFMEHRFKKDVNHHPGGFVYGTQIQEGCQSLSWWICLWNTSSRRILITILVDLFMEHGFKKGVNHHPGGFVYGTRIQEGCQSPSWWICLWNTDSRRVSITILVDLFMEHEFKKDLNHHPGGFVYGTRIQEGCQSPSWWICLWNTDSRRVSITILVDLFMEHGFKKGLNHHPGGFKKKQKYLCTATYLVLTNILWKDSATQVITSCLEEQKLVKNAKIIGNEECITQYKLLVDVFKIQTPTEKPCFR